MHFRFGVLRLGLQRFGVPRFGVPHLRVSALWVLRLGTSIPSGPPRQATGTTLVGCRGGGRNVEGVP